MYINISDKQLLSQGGQDSKFLNMKNFSHCLPASIYKLCENSRGNWFRFMLFLVVKILRCSSVGRGWPLICQSLGAKKGKNGPSHTSMVIAHFPASCFILSNAQINTFLGIINSLSEFLSPFIQQMICFLTTFCQYSNHLSH